MTFNSCYQFHLVLKKALCKQLDQNEEEQNGSCSTSPLYSKNKLILADDAFPRDATIECQTPVINDHADVVPRDITSTCQFVIWLNQGSKELIPTSEYARYAGSCVKLIYIPVDGSHRREPLTILNLTYING